MVASPKPLAPGLATSGGAQFACPGHGIIYRPLTFPAAFVRSGGHALPPRRQQRLADFISENNEAILNAWEEAAITIEPEISRKNIAEMRHHAQQMLVALAAGLASEEADGSDPTAEMHAAQCLRSGYTVVQLVAEYHALRRSVLALWSKAPRRTLTTDTADVMRFNDAVDQALSESVARYQQLVDQSQNMFLAILGHDLRNPLGTLVAGASLMMNDVDLAPKHVMVATRMFSSARRMKKLIDDFIDFTRTHLGSGIPVKTAPGNLVAVCWQVVNELRTAYPKRFVDLRTPPKLEAVFDADRIAQVLSNLIGNALQYGNEVFPVRVWVVARDDSIEIAVNNRGAIIPPDRIAHVFEAMVRLAPDAGADTAGRTSLGIGLYISREIVQAHGGKLTVVSNIDHGTTFKVSLPRICKPR